MLYILYGQDDFSLRETLGEIKSGLDDLGLLEANTTNLDGRSLSLGELRKACDATPFLAPQRLVIVEGLLGRFERGGVVGRRRRPTEVEEWQAFVAYIKEVPSSTVLVLVDEALGGRNPLLEELSHIAEVRRFLPLRGLGLRDWIVGRVKGSGGSISHQAVRALSELVGSDLWVLASEIEKLLLYTSGRRIEESDVRQVASYAREANVFSMVDALLQAQATAGRLLHQLLDEGASPAYLLFMIARQFRLLVRAKEFSQRGLSAVETQRRLGLTSEYASKKTVMQAESYSMPRLKEAYQILLETDLAIKTGRLKDELALDLLVAELCRVEPERPLYIG